MRDPVLAGIVALLAITLAAANAPCNPGLPIPADCREVRRRGCTEDGVYTIDPGCSKPFKVPCDMTNGQWMVFQRRRNGQQSFNQNWTEYRNGFGDMKWEFWLGLEKIHCLTAAYRRPELRVDVADNTGRSAFAQYNYFALESEKTNYTLHFGTYSGTANDGFTLCAPPWRHQGLQFSTPDRDNDIFDRHHCARGERAGWWFNQCYCSNLNGEYKPYLFRWFSFSEKVKFTEMKVR